MTRRDYAGVVLISADRVARCAEIEQHQAAIFLAHIDVVSLDVTMQIAGLMHNGQTIEQRLEQSKQVLFRQVRMLAPPCLERFAALVVEHHVSGAVRFEKARDAHDIRMTESRQRTRFYEEAFEPVLVKLLVFRPT